MTSKLTKKEQAWVDEVVPDEITSASAPEVFEIAAEAERLGLRGTYASYAVGWNACRAAMLNHPSSIQPNTDATPGAEIKHPSSNSPVIPDGYVMVPNEATEKMLIAGLEEANPLGGLIDWDASRGDCNTRAQVQGIFKAMLAAAPQEEPDGK
ncbi:hypothetical protein FMK59_14435 [Klebsiella michiganensis]|jgi:hypothetical protein|uniref:hypothetical protein n=1 Tax=Klebsiella michiganensis TaxID=1134687 RepID=UPI001CCE5F7B|nr:hypothetical protein [Klebsiella michiganensis]MBZ7186865.1 hypothetical protein [Klebsiella michiganensis]